MKSSEDPAEMVCKELAPLRGEREASTMEGMEIPTDHGNCIFC
jgi:hypothetical protein